MCILAVVALDSSTALGANTGGASASPTVTATTPATPAKPAIHLDPVTAKTPKLAYNGPIYEKTATGEVVPYQPTLVTSTPAAQVNPTGGSPVGVTATSTSTTAKPELLVPGTLARYVDGLAAAPMGVPAAVQEIIWAGNDLIGLPYIYGGGHASFSSPGYDCSGTVSFALHGADLFELAGGLRRIRNLGLAWRRPLRDDLRQRRPRVHDGGGAAPRHERGRRPLGSAGPALAPAAPGQRRLRRAAPARALSRSRPPVG